MSVKCMLAEQVKGGSGGDPIVLQRIAVTTPPTKTAYETGKSFDTAGMVVTGYYGPSASVIVAEIALTGYSYSPSTFTTAGSQNVTITYSKLGITKTATQAVTVEAAWEWGDETASGAGDATWWAGLQKAVKAGKAQSSWVGKTKSVTLTSSVLGTTTHLIRCIGVNQDGDNTITFQTANCLADMTGFSGSGAAWIGSIVRTQCTNYYNAFPGKSYIKTVSKGTCPSVDYSRVGTPTYNNETVWLPSEREMGCDYNSPISTANSTTTKAECTYGYNAAYAYYSSNNNRIKKNGDSGSAYRYWERSHSYNGSNAVCLITESGGPLSANCFNGYGLAPAFVIG